MDLTLQLSFHHFRLPFNWGLFSLVSASFTRLYFTQDKGTTLALNSNSEWG
jgi:hypothetical protein